MPIAKTGQRKVIGDAFVTGLLDRGIGWIPIRIHPNKFKVAFGT